MVIVDYYLDAFRKYFDFKGSADRPTYWWFALANFIVSFLIGLISAKIQFIYALAVLIPSIAILVRRIRNTGYSPWHALWLLLPIIGPIIVLIFAVLPSKGRK